MRLQWKHIKNNPRANARHAWIVLSLSLIALVLASYAAAQTEQTAHTHPPIKTASGGGVLLSGGTLLIDINQADKALLMELPGIGQARADAIIAYREVNGAFTSIDELKTTIPKNVLEAIRDRITV